MPSTFLALKGGLDLQSPPIAVPPASLAYASNFFESVKGGYTKLHGYERFDGQPRPSDATYYLIRIEQWDLRATPAPFTVGDDFTVGSAVYNILSFYESDDGTYVEVITTHVSGTPPVDLETNNLPYDTNCLIVSVGVRDAQNEADNLKFLRDAQEARRVLIQPVPGVGPVRGIAQVGDDKVAWRDDSEGKLQAFRATDSGWASVPYAQVLALYYQYDLARGEELNGGKYVIFDRYPYSVDDGNRQIVVVAKTDPSIPDLIPGDAMTRDHDSEDLGAVAETHDYEWTGGGKVRFHNHNFYGGTSSRCMYFADGVNCAGEYNPNYKVITPISGNYRNVTEVITHVVAHNSRLIMATDGGSWITSIVGEPRNIDGVLGSTEVGVGDDITGFHRNGSTKLTIFTRRTTLVLDGTGSDNWNLQVVTPDAGAIPDCVTSIDEPFALDDRGINKVTQTDTLGGFAAATITDDVQSLFNIMKGNATCATNLRELNQMRFFFGSSFLIASRVPYTVGGQSAVRYGLTRGDYNVPVLCVSSQEDASGKEWVLFGSDDGYVYQADRGPSFDGVEMTSVLTLHANHLKSPGQKKRYRYADFEMTASNSIELDMTVELDGGKQSTGVRTVSVEGTQQGYDLALYNESVYDGVILSRQRVPLVGTATSIQFTLNHISDVDQPFTIHGYTLTYTKRGLRGY